MSEQIFNVIRQGRGRRKAGETTIKQAILGIINENPQASNKELIALAVATGLKVNTAQVYVSKIRKEKATPVAVDLLPNNE